ncbi:MAG: histidine kinase dimerization/phosphoacceptor domain-containing protein [Micromonosporaceae bacterium]
MAPSSPGSDPTRRAAVGVVVFSAVIPVIEVIFVGQLRGVRAMLVVGAITACVLPGFLLLVLHTVRGTKMRYAGWVLATATAAVALCRVLTDAWVLFVPFGVSALIVLRVPLSLLIVALGITAPSVWDLLAGDGMGMALWSWFSLVWQVSTVFSVVWLAGVMRRLRVARTALAERAVASERDRTEGELRRALGGSLTAIAADGERAAGQLREEPDTAAATIERLTTDARATLADARRVIAEFSRGSLRSELATARSLLAAAGIDATVDASDAADDEAVRSSLRDVVAALLVDPPARGTVVTISQRDGSFRYAARAPGGTR